MGLGASHRGGSAPSHRAEPLRRRRPWIRRTISSFLLCGAPSSSSRVMEDFPAELLMNSEEIGDGERLKDKIKGSDLSLGGRAALVDIRVSSRRCMTGNDITALETGIVGPGDKGKCLSESGSMISCESRTNSSNDDGTASASSMVQPSPDRFSASEIAEFDAAKNINSTTSRESSQIFEALSNSNNLPSHCYGGESSLDEASAGNSTPEAIDYYSETSSSLFHNSPMAFHSIQDDSPQGRMPSTAGFIVLGRDQNRQERTLRQGDLMSVSSSSLTSVSSNSHDIRNFTAFSFSRNTVFSTDGSEYSRSPDGSHHDFSREFSSDNLQGSFGSHGQSELAWNSRSEFWETLRGSRDATDTLDVCPRRVHAGSSCLCRSGLSAEESGSRAISQMVLLAQTLFEVLDQIHQQPMSVSLSIVSRPASESVVESLPVKIHTKEKILECEEDISQCYICLGAYEEGDKVRVLPCHHEYHMSCVDKWLKEIHGVCPLCRGDVCKGVTEASCPNLEILPH